MCGISGVVSRQAQVDAGVVERMHGALRHRGPDEDGTFAAAHVVMASRRLAIVDTQGGSQPLYSEDRSVVLVANGEIYNHAELRAMLLAKGHQFATASDCEVIVHLYEEFGENCIEHLRGMFALALWDEHRRHLVLARDRMGEKPLYLHFEPGSLLFASELKAVLASRRVPFALDADAVDQYFHQQYVSDPMTPVRGVVKLPPAHLLVYDVDRGVVTQRKYWTMDADAVDDDPARVLRRELDSFAPLVSQADVPVGVALSGGIDSALVAALVARARGGDVHAFTVGYTGRPVNDERTQAQSIADWLGIPWHQVELDKADVVAAFPDVVRAADDPIADVSAFGYSAVAGLARECGVPVLFQGQGSDELFWGYSWVREALDQSMRRAERRQRLAGPASPRLSAEAPPQARLSFYDRNIDFRQAKRELGRLYHHGFTRLLDPGRAHLVTTRALPWPRLDLEITQLICGSYLLENGLAQGDRLAMSHSVELRVPLVDHRFVELVMGLRKARPDHGELPKGWLRAAAVGLLPDEVLNRPKRPFEAPIADWHEALFVHYGHTLVDGFLVGHGILRGEAAELLSHGPRPAGSGSSLSYKALVLENWCRAMARDGDLPGAPAGPPLGRN
ncbi:asparagine synthase (glutamine-hydrolyzing) [Saccharothrix tamanrassetensis]|uniref:asparagine synthase (glutamine-hydrolyzing) n=1 Tax=Saccharothrix tamanrassetensis TaxID=1051531 RepID=A0A841CJR5_9PSEU|nr:asparagine synthase (glutamine-hydrolyzing) [Saccharothrix tamanrassetensis]MBB5957310.1 asparagine synthase (glutamine-hydrolyzing) [Saccharothrix tamanrassetensis]